MSVSLCVYESLWVCVNGWLCVWVTESNKKQFVENNLLVGGFVYTAL